MKTCSTADLLLSIVPAACRVWLPHIILIRDSPLGTPVYLGLDRVASSDCFVLYTYTYQTEVRVIFDIRYSILNIEYQPDGYWIFKISLKK